MRVLFCSSWPRDDGLTRATVEPAVEALRALDVVDDVELSAPEQPQGAGMLARAREVRSDLRALRSTARSFAPDVIIARGVPAGNLAQRVARECGAKLVIESFEPHARYMRDAGEWAWWDPRYLAQVMLERRQSKRADHLVVVADGYRKHLIDSGHASGNVSVMPCLVDTDRFAFDEVTRKEMRDSLGLTEDAIVLVHLGKFGGVYYDAEAFAALAEFVDHVGPERVRDRAHSTRCRIGHRAAVEAGVPTHQIWVRAIGHDLVSSYLSAADIAINTWMPIDTSFACSPVKNGEYWAAGLPVLISTGIGDDSDLIIQHRLGWAGDLTEPAALRNGIEQVLAVGSEPGSRQRIAEFAAANRSIERLGPHYEQVLSRLV